MLMESWLLRVSCKVSEAQNDSRARDPTYLWFHEHSKNRIYFLNNHMKRKTFCIFCTFPTNVTAKWNSYYYMYFRRYRIHICAKYRCITAEMYKLWNLCKLCLSFIFCGLPPIVTCVQSMELSCLCFKHGSSCLSGLVNCISWISTA